MPRIPPESYIITFGSFTSVEVFVCVLVNGLSPGASGRPSVKWPMCLPSLGIIRHGSNSEMTGSTLVVLPGHKTVTQTALNVLRHTHTHTHTP
jgi:hypothetical protein